MRSPEWIKELAQHHTGGYLKIAPEHTEDAPLRHMMKPGIGTYDRFKELFDRYTKEAARLYRVLDTRLAGREYVCDEFTVADCACWPWTFFRLHHGIDLADYPNVQRWYRTMENRASVKRVMGDKQPPPPIAPDKDALRVLFNVDEQFL